MHCERVLYSLLHHYVWVCLIGEFLVWWSKPESHSGGAGVSLTMQTHIYFQKEWFKFIGWCALNLSWNTYCAGHRWCLEPFWEPGLKNWYKANKRACIKQSKCNVLICMAAVEKGWNFMILHKQDFILFLFICIHNILSKGSLKTKSNIGGDINKTGLQSCIVTVTIFKIVIFGVITLFIKATKIKNNHCRFKYRHINLSL